jgi:acetate kinase
VISASPSGALRLPSPQPFRRQGLLIDDDVAAEVEALEDLAPLHNAATPAGIRAYCRILGPRLPMMAVFETAFHAIIGQKRLPESA